jgi:hypothetical protein
MMRARRGFSDVWLVILTIIGVAFILVYLGFVIRYIAVPLLRGAVG